MKNFLPDQGMLSRRRFVTGAGLGVCSLAVPAAALANGPRSSAKKRIALPKTLCGWNGSGGVTMHPTTETDSRLSSAIDRISMVMGFRPKYEIVADGQRQILQVVTRSKTVQVGQAMKRKIYADATYAEEVLIGLVSHEVAHIMQLEHHCYIDLFSATHGGDFFKSMPCFKSWVYENGDLSPLELHADFIAGWVMARLSLLTIDRFEGFAKVLFEKGDYYVGQPGAHGTPTERLNAMANGYYFGVEGELVGFYPNENMRGRTLDRSSPLSAFEAGQATLAAWL